MNKPLVAIFAGSKIPSNPEAVKDIIYYATKLGEDGFDIIYGGGDCGAMGLIAKSAQMAGAHVHAVVLDKYKEEKQLPGVTMYNVATDLDRFSLMHNQDNLVACLMFPGGPGSIREGFQALEAAVYEKSVPLIIPDIGTVSLRMYELFEASIEEGYIKEADSNACLKWNKNSFLSEILNPELVYTNPGF